VAKVGTSNSDCTISLRLQCIVKKHNKSFDKIQNLSTVTNKASHYNRSNRVVNKSKFLFPQNGFAIKICIRKCNVRVTQGASRSTLLTKSIRMDGWGK
jgi:hypothetical protein